MTWQKASSGQARQIGVDRENGVIRGVILAEEGPFKSEGRGEFDGKSIRQIAALAKEHPAGLKSRFTHPDMSSDGLGKFLGRTRMIRRETIERDGQQVSLVRGDHHFAQSAYSTPNGDLATYLMDVAEEDPDAIGLSLVLETEEEFRLEKDGTPKLDENGNMLPPLWRPTRLHAVDFVDEGDATNSLLGQSLSIDGLPDEVVRKAAALLRQQFDGKTRDFVEPRLNAWVARVLSHYWPEDDGEEAIVEAATADDLQRRLKQKLRLASCS